jgi:hypothetical protein
MQEKGLYQPSDYFQVGVVVKSIDETVKYLKEIIGISGPIEFRDVIYQCNLLWRNGWISR